MHYIFGAFQPKPDIHLPTTDPLYHLHSHISPKLNLTRCDQLSRGQRPLTPNVVAIALDTERICGSRVAVGGSSADSVGQVTTFGKIWLKFD